MLARRVILVAGFVAVAVAYSFLVAALNRPPAAHAPAGGAIGVRTTTTVAVATTTTTVLPLIRPGPLRAPNSGAYPLHVTTNGAESDVTLFVDKDGSQRFAVGGVTRTSRLRWTKAHAELVGTGNATGDGACAWNPGPVYIASKLTEGRSWSSDAMCVTTAGDATLTIRRQETAKVTRRVRAQVRSEPLDAWLIERHVITTSRGPGGTVITEDASSELFAPRIGLSIYILRRTDTPRPDGRVDSITEKIELRAAAPS